MFRIWCAALLSILVAASLPAETLYRDPMRPYEPPAEGRSAEPARYRLSTVLISSSRRVAVVNDQVCRVGDRVDGAEVIEIESEWVRLRVGSAYLTVALAGRAQREITQEEAAP